MAHAVQIVKPEKSEFIRYTMCMLEIHREQADQLKYLTCYDKLSAVSGKQLSIQDKLEQGQNKIKSNL